MQLNTVKDYQTHFPMMRSTGIKIVFYDAETNQYYGGADFEQVIDNCAIFNVTRRKPPRLKTHKEGQLPPRKAVIVDSVVSSDEMEESHSDY